MILNDTLFWKLCAQEVHLSGITRYKYPINLNMVYGNIKSFQSRSTMSILTYNTFKPLYEFKIFICVFHCSAVTAK